MIVVAVLLLYVKPFKGPAVVIAVINACEVLLPLLESLNLQPVNSRAIGIFCSAFQFTFGKQLKVKKFIVFELLYYVGAASPSISENRNPVDHWKHHTIFFLWFNAGMHAINLHRWMASF